MGFKFEDEDILVEYEDEPGVTKVVIPNNVVYITSRAFNQSSITSVVIPASVESIDTNSFYYCENLVKVTFPETSIIIENDAFYRCDRFTANISIKEWNPAFGLSKALYARNYMNHYDADDTHYELYHEENSHYITQHLDEIIETLKNSDTGAVIYLTREKMLSLYRTNMLLDKMSGNIEATTVLLDYKHNAFPAEYHERYERENTEKELGLRERTPADWRKIFKLVSDGSGGLAIAKYLGTDTIVDIPEKIGKQTVTGIMKGAFQSQDPDFFIDDNSADNCAKIEEVILPDTITVIEDNAFEYCENLKYINLPNSIKKIGYFAFRSTGLTSIAIPDSISHINACMFSGCTALEKVVLPDNLKRIGDNAFAGCKRLSAITLPETLNEIGKEAFSSCSSLTEIVIPSQITEIHSGLFFYCSSLKKITLPGSLRTIGEYAFKFCQSLTSIDIPNGVTEIKECAFSNCSSLTSVKMPDSVHTLGDYAFEGCTKLADITISKGLEVFGYSCFEDTAWLKNQKDDFIICGNNVLFLYQGSDSEVVIPDGVKIIGDSSFKDNKKITRVTIPEGVVEIQDKAFVGCSNLTHVTFPQSLKEIGQIAFFKTALSEITLPNDLNQIDMGAFGNCNIRSVTIPQSVQVIYGEAFSGCAQLAEVNFPENPPIIFAGAFDYTPYFDNLPGDFVIFGEILHKYRGTAKKVIVPDNIKVIGERAFRDNRFVTEIVVPDGVTVIEIEAFGNCKKLKSIILPDTLTYLCDFDINETAYNVDLKIRYKENIYDFSYNKHKNTIFNLCKMINSETKKKWKEVRGVFI